MNDSNIYIKFENHFKLYLKSKDKIIFEHELRKSRIDYHFDE